MFGDEDVCVLCVVTGSYIYQLGMYVAVVSAKLNIKNLNNETYKKHCSSKLNRNF